MTRYEYYLAKAKHQKEKLDRQRKKRDNEYDPFNRASGAAVTGPVGPAATTGGSISTPSPF